MLRLCLAHRLHQSAKSVIENNSNDGFNGKGIAEGGEV
jgi:hypothetical protein